MEKFHISPIGFISVSEAGYRILLNETCKQGMIGLDGFDTLQILWWCSDYDTPAFCQHLLEEKPYLQGPDVLGIFATRSPMRPNPIAISNAKVIHLDAENGILQLNWIDARNGTPVLDIKPYMPCIDRVQNVCMPDWCAAWPAWAEDSEGFDWSGVFQNVLTE